MVSTGGGAIQPRPRAQAAAAARKALTSLNGALHLVSSARLDDVQLLTSELVANAILHGGDRESLVRVEVRASKEALRVVVSDVGVGFDPTRLPGPSADRGGGWGLRLVAHELLVDLRAVAFVDSALLAILLHTDHQLRRQGRAIVCVTRPGPVEHLLDGTGLRETLQLFATPEAAVRPRGPPTARPLTRRRSRRAGAVGPKARPEPAGVGTPVVTLQHFAGRAS